MPEIKSSPVLLEEIVATVRRHAPAEARRWFVDGVGIFFAGGERLDEALGLRVASNARTPLKKWQFEQRDAHIRSALRHCAGAADFLQRLAEFENGVWQSAQRKQHPPKSWPPLNAELFGALRAGVPIPRTCRRIEQILQSETSSARCFGDALQLLSDHDLKLKELRKKK